MRSSWASHNHSQNHAFWHADRTCTYIPPKKVRAALREYGIRNGLQVPEREVKRVDSRNMREDEPQRSAQDAEVGDKRKKSSTPEEANKSLKVTTRLPSPAASASPKSSLKATPVQVLRFLLSDEGLSLCRPADELEDVETRGKDITTYSTLLSPFEELLCAVVLSRPISHRLGLRTIRTVLNAPYKFCNPVAIKTAGSKKVREALEAAHTQHKDKTAEEIELLADAVSNNNWHNDLSKIRSSSKHAVETEREILRRSVKGLGKTGLDIFYRRIQWAWKEAYPFIDARTLASLEKLGLPRRAEGIEKMIEVRWDQLGFEKGVKKYSVEEKRRRAFVVLLERAVGADLEKKIDEVLERAAELK